MVKTARVSSLHAINWDIQKCFCCVRVTNILPALTSENRIVFDWRNMKPLLNADVFGAIDADNDDLLLECFEDHEAYLDVRSRQRFVIVGRKGSGKTAIFKKLLVIGKSSYFCFGHTFSDYPWHYHDKQARIGIPDFDKYTHSWKYLILLTLAKIILNQDLSL